LDTNRLKATIMSATFTRISLVSLVVFSLVAACDMREPEPARGFSVDEAPVTEEGVPMADLGVGEIELTDDEKADGNWGFATSCKPIPELEPLIDPEIVISLDGLTVHLMDRASDFERVYPIGPGAIEDGESLTPTSLHRPGQTFYARLDKPSVKESGSPTQKWAWTYSCRMWWKDNDNGGALSPVFAGLPFIRLEGASPAVYGLHGPIDSYTSTTGGRLRRGFVSHGCIRMEADDIVELYALGLGHRIPVRIQRATERYADGSFVEVDDTWIGSTCETDDECAYAGGECRVNPFTLHGTCTKACTRYCPDRWGYPTTFCVDDPEDDSRGTCVVKAQKLNNECRRYPGSFRNPGEPRHGQPWVKANVCAAGSEGWIGQPCWSNVDCLLSGGTCDLSDAGEDRPGFCTVGCNKYCPDHDGFPTTFCVAGGADGQCVQRCQIQDDCPTGYTCTETQRNHQSWVTRKVCL
jgi:L,D-transpeptidase catalytic domain